MIDDFETYCKKNYPEEIAEPMIAYYQGLRKLGISKEWAKIKVLLDALSILKELKEKKNE